MKRILPPAGLSALVALACAIPFPSMADAADPAPGAGLEFRFGGVALDDDAWDDDAAGAFDLGFSFWEPSRVFGLWLGVGAQGASYKWNDDWGEVKSDVFAVPFGASLLVRVPLCDVLALRAEAGARYVRMDMDDWDDDKHHSHGHRRHRRGDLDRYYHPEDYVDVGDTALAVAGLQLEFAMDPVRLAVGGGYQFDIGSAEVEYEHERIGELDLSGAFLYASVAIFF